MKLNIQNWRDRNGSDLDKARRLLDNREVSGDYISKVTGINNTSISNYRTGKTDVSRAKWEIVNRLAQMQDMLDLSPYIGENGENVIKFSSVLNEFFSENREAYKDDKRFLGMIKVLEDIVATDPQLLVELMKPFFVEEK